MTKDVMRAFQVWATPLHCVLIAREVHLVETAEVKASSRATLIGKLVQETLGRQVPDKQTAALARAVADLVGQQAKQR